MKIITNDPNYLVIHINSRRRGFTFRVLFSYLTPVAISNTDGNYFVTDRKYSVTTSGHINRFLDGFPNPISMPQHYFNTIEEQVV